METCYDASSQCCILSIVLYEFMKSELYYYTRNTTQDQKVIQ